MHKLIIRKMTEEAVFFISFLLALMTSFFVNIDFSSINYKVIASLFSLMLIVTAFERYSLLEFTSLQILKRYDTPRKIGFAMILTTSLLAMLVTNDVALITVVPLTILVAKKAGFNPLLIIILETLAANIGSSLTPFGNPQNLFLFEYYHIENIQFFKITSLFVFFGITAVLILNIRNHNDKLHFSVDNITMDQKGKIIIYLALFILIILSILRVIPFWLIFFLAVFLFFILDAKLFLKVDYFLLGTFVNFFVLVDNLAKIPFIYSFLTAHLEGEHQSLTVAILASQLISNVPAAVMLSGFTENYRELLLGVNIGGLGTLIASLANLISFKFYIKEFGSRGFFVPFHAINFGLLVSVSFLFIYILM